MKPARSWRVFDKWSRSQALLSWSITAGWASTARLSLTESLQALEHVQANWDTRLAAIGVEPSRQDWTRFRPLRLNREEDWSDWLAFLIEASESGEFSQAVFGTELAPRDGDLRRPRVDREVVTRDGANRADLVIHWRTGGRTVVEIKIGDLSLEKTDVTAAGVGATHSCIVLPEADLAAWAAAVPHGSRTATRSWEQVAVALRCALWGGVERASWQSWAIAYVGKIEQELLRLPVLSSGGVGETISSMRARLDRLNIMLAGATNERRRP